MGSYSVTVLYDASNGADFEASSPQEACELAAEQFGPISLCHQCGQDIDISDVSGCLAYKDGEMVYDSTQWGGLERRYVKLLRLAEKLAYAVEYATSDDAEDALLAELEVLKNG